MARSRSKGFKFTETDIILVGGAAAFGVVALVAGARGNPVSPPSPPGSISRITINSNYTSVTEGGSINFFGLALDAFNNPVVGARLYFLTDGSSVTNTVTTTGGQYAFTISFSTAPGQYSVYVSTAP